MASLVKECAENRDSGEVRLPAQVHLLDLCDDFLMDIFEYLDRCDLLKIVDVCVRFRNIGRVMYAKKFKKEEMTIHWSEKSMLLLSRFGCVIPNLKVTVELLCSDGFFRILKNCCNNLAELCILQSLETPNDPAGNLMIDEQLEWKFPNLTKFKFRKCVVTTECLVHFLSVSPQIQNLFLYDATPINATTVPKFIKYFGRLTELHIKDGWKLDLTCLIDPKFEFVSLQKFTIWCDALGEHGRDIVKFSSRAPNIRQIEVVSYELIAISIDTIIELFQQNRFLIDFSAYVLDNNRRNEFNKNFLEKLCEVTSNREDFRIKLIVNSYTEKAFNVNINKKLLTIKGCSLDDERFVIEKILGN